MKKYFALCFVCLGLGACEGTIIDDHPEIEAPAPQKKEVRDEKATYIKEERVEAGQPYASDYERFENNVMIKDKTVDKITYEYKDVRIDEIYPIAKRYCAEQGLKDAVLRESILYHNFSRRATFDCVEFNKDNM